MGELFTDTYNVMMSRYDYTAIVFSVYHLGRKYLKYNVFY